MPIPKIIHQIWIGPKPKPSVFMDTWKNKNPNFEYISWSENEIQKRNVKLNCLKQINCIPEINGKADIIRWELLYYYGGVFVDADSICIEPIDDHLMQCNAFSGYENEHVRTGLVSTGTMGFPPRHPLCLAAIKWILNPNNEWSIKTTQAWKTVGPLCLTNLLKTGLYDDVTVFPSYYFLPIHYTGESYSGHKKVYAHQEWGSTKQNYEIMNDVTLPDVLADPPKESCVSVLICSHDACDAMRMGQCLNSIIEQQGYFGMELVWINDGCSLEQEQELEQELTNFQMRSRFCKVVYVKTKERNERDRVWLHDALLLCTNELVIRMNVDDAIGENAIKTQLEFMKSNPNCALCSSDDGQQLHIDNTDECIQSHWAMHHPSLCFKKSAVLNALNNVTTTMQ